MVTHGLRLLITIVLFATALSFLVVDAGDELTYWNPPDQRHESAFLYKDNCPESRTVDLRPIEEQPARPTTDTVEPDNFATERASITLSATDPVGLTGDSRKSSGSAR